MLSQPLDPMNPRHRAVLLAAALLTGILMVLLADVAIPALVARQIGAGS